MKELKIEIPDGYEIDEEKSTFENIVFKEKNIVNSYNDLKEVSGYFIGLCSEITNHSSFPNIPGNYNMFRTKAQAESAIAMAQLSQILPHYDTDVDWNDSRKIKYCIMCCTCNHDQILYIDYFYGHKHFLAFNSKGEAERFLKHNEHLIRVYYMMPKIY